MEEATGECRLGCLGSLGRQRKGGLGDRFRELAPDKLPAAHCLRFRRHVPVKKEVGEAEGNGAVCSPEGDGALVPLSLSFYLSCRWES